MRRVAPPRPEQSLATRLPRPQGEARPRRRGPPAPPRGQVRRPRPLLRRPPGRLRRRQEGPEEAARRRRRRRPRPRPPRPHHRRRRRRRLRRPARPSAGLRALRWAGLLLRARARARARARWRRRRRRRRPIRRRAVLTYRLTSGGPPSSATPPASFCFSRFSPFPLFFRAEGSFSVSAPREAAFWRGTGDLGIAAGGRRRRRRRHNAVRAASFSRVRKGRAE